MEFTSSKHAADALKAREIDPAWIATTIKSPEKTTSPADDRTLIHALSLKPYPGTRQPRFTRHLQSQQNTAAHCDGVF